MITYPFIIAYGRSLGSNPSYIAHQMALAEADRAPWDAVYKCEERGWRTARDFGSISAGAMIPFLPNEQEMQAHVNLANRQLTQ